MLSVGFSTQSTTMQAECPPCNTLQVWGWRTATAKLTARSTLRVEGRPCFRRGRFAFSAHAKIGFYRNGYLEGVSHLRSVATGSGVNIWRRRRIGKKRNDRYHHRHRNDSGQRVDTHRGKCMARFVVLNVLQPDRDSLTSDGSSGWQSSYERRTLAV